MIYFDIMDPMEILDMEQRGQLLTAILTYSKEGTMPDFGGDKLLMMAWSMVQKSIDRDDESYKQTILRRRYASYCKWEKDAGRVPVSFEEWMKIESGEAAPQSDAKQKKQVHKSAKQKKPKTTTTPTSTTTSTPTPTSSTTSTSTTTPTQKEITVDDDSLSLSSRAEKTAPAVKIPTKEEVREYVEINGLYVDPDVFFAYQEKKAWSGVQDWKAELRYWHARNRSNAGAGPGSGGVGVEHRRKGSYFTPTAPGYMSYEEYTARAKPAEDEDDTPDGIKDL